MKALFVTSGPPIWASARMRAQWVARYMDADVWDIQDVARMDVSIYDAFIFIKVGHLGLFKQLLQIDKQVWWDVCDPSWWFSPGEAREFGDIITGVVASCQPLVDDFNKWYGTDKCHFIPDRLEFSHFPLKKVHQYADPVRFIWYGAMQNRTALFATLANMERLAANGYHIELTIYDDHPENDWNLSDKYPIYYSRWDVDKENAVIAGHDIALLPAYPGPWGKVKSNNKILTAWACGLPVTDAQDYEALERLVASTDERIENTPFAFEDADVKESAKEWMELLCNR
jgi:hypothetical protein